MQKSRKLLLISFTAGIAMIAGIVLFVFVFPRALNNDALISMHYAEVNGKSYILKYYRETGSDDDRGTYLTGYELECIDPMTRKKSKLFIKRSDDNMPPDPALFTFDNRVYLLQNRQFVQGDQGFVQTLIITPDGQLQPADNAELKGMIPSQQVGKRYYQFYNQYEEQYCLNLYNGELSEGDCFLRNDPGNGLSCFFTVGKTNSSTRRHLYYFSTEDQPENEVCVIRSASAVFDNSIPEDLEMNRYAIDEEQLKRYREILKEQDEINTVYDKKFLYNPVTLSEDDGRLVLASTDSSGTRVLFHLFDKNDGELWEYQPEKAHKHGALYFITAVYTDAKTIIIDPKLFVLAIDNKTGKLLWEYRN